MPPPFLLPFGKNYLSIAQSTGTAAIRAPPFNPFGGSSTMDAGGALSALDPATIASAIDLINRAKAIDIVDRADKLDPAYPPKSISRVVSKD